MNVQKKVCPQCGQPGEHGDVFCGGCGQGLPAQPKQEESPTQVEVQDAAASTSKGGQLRAWLARIGLSEYAVAFEREGIDYDLVHSLTDDDLRELGVSKLGDRKRILLEAQSQDLQPAVPHGRPLAAGGLPSSEVVIGNYQSVLKFGGIALCASFMLPWMAQRKLAFAWDFLDKAEGALAFFIVFIPIAGITALVISMHPQVSAKTRLAVGIALGTIPALTVLVSDANEYLGKEYGIVDFFVLIVLCLWLLALGVASWTASNGQTWSRLLIGGAALGMAGIYWLPIALGDNALFLVLAGLLDKAKDEVVPGIVYALLPFAIAACGAVLALVPIRSMSAFRATTAAVKWAAIGWLPGLLLLFAIWLWSNEMMIFIPFFAGVAVLVYTTFFVAGASLYVSNYLRTQA